MQCPLVDFNTDTCLQPINLFLRSGDALYGPIMTVWRKGRIVKRIPWAAFDMTGEHWQRVLDARDLLKVHNSGLKFQVSACLRAISRILITSNSISHPNDSLRSGALFLPSRSFKLLGRPNESSHVSLRINMPSTMGSKSSKSTIPALMKSLVTYLRSVSELELHAQD